MKADLYDRAILPETGPKSDMIAGRSKTSLLELLLVFLQCLYKKVNCGEKKVSGLSGRTPFSFI